MLVLFLPEETKKTLSALDRQRHEIRIVGFLIAGDGQQRPLRRDREPAIVHSNQESDDFPRRVPPWLRSNVLNLCQNRWPRFSVQEPSRAVQRRQFSSLHVELDEIHLRNALFRENIIDAAYPHAHLARRIR